MKPFYFSVCFWGERFRNYFVNYCFPSLGQPSRPWKMLIATTREDWNALPEYLRNERFFELLEIPSCPEGTIPATHMGVGHKAAALRCLQDGAYSVPLTPDLVLSCGAIERLDQLARAGAEVVLAPAMRFEEERALPFLRPKMEPRALVKVALNSLHSESVSYEWKSHIFPEISPITWFRASGGIVGHFMSWAPLLLDYSAVKGYDSTCLDKWTMDGNYVISNWGCSDKIHVVQDSDELFLLSWAPADDRPWWTTPQEPFKISPFISYMVKSHIMRLVYNWELFDPLKKELFFLPIRIHSGDIDSSWLEVERRSRFLLTKLFGVPNSRGFRLGDLDEKILVNPAVDPLRLCGD